jgi:hypothetical protein
MQPSLSDDVDQFSFSRSLIVKNIVSLLKTFYFFSLERDVVPVIYIST